MDKKEAVHWTMLLVFQGILVEVLLMENHLEMMLKEKAHLMVMDVFLLMNAIPSGPLEPPGPQGPGRPQGPKGTSRPEILPSGRTVIQISLSIQQT